MHHFPEKNQTGGLTGQGFANLLGSPRLATMTLVLREAAQNSWDARRKQGLRDEGAVRFGVCVRNLTAAQERAFRGLFENAKVTEGAAKDRLAMNLRSEGGIRVLELSDQGTVGLCGPTRPDEPLNGSRSRFVDFFFDVGKSHVESGDGGTYGFGRSSLYLAGKAATIIVDSLVKEERASERRLMACRIGDSFEKSTTAAKGRYSGRHFWGRATGGVAQPVVGAEAATLVRKLGMPAREAGDFGTTILIPWPVEEFNNGEMIVNALVRNLWPKMVPDGNRVHMSFEVRLDGREYPIPDPSAMNEYRLFVDALKLARGRDTRRGAIAIQTKKPRFVTGHLSVASGALNLPSAAAGGSVDDDEDRAPSPLAINHVALMRPSELVVRYLPVSRTDLPDRSWAGVFICSAEEAVRAAFARSEPPAHDDWVDDRLADTRERYLVRKSVGTLIPEAVRELLGVGPVLVTPQETGGPSLAAASARFSAALLSGIGQLPRAIGPDTSGHGGARGTRPPVRSVRIQTPVPVGLKLIRGRPVAVFAIRVTGPRGSEVLLQARPEVFVESRLDELPGSLELPTVAGWEGGTEVGENCSVFLREGAAAVQVLIAINGEYGVTLECAILDGAE